MDSPFLPPDPTAVTNADRLLPSQDLMRRAFRGDDFSAALDRVTTQVLPVKSVAEKFDLMLSPGFSYEMLGSDLSTLHFLQLLVRIIGAGRVLEIGTYIGVSAMFMAEAMAPGGIVHTFEPGAEFCALARENFRRNGFDEDHIKLHHARADLALPLMTDRGYFDLIFLDGDKANYGRLLANLLTSLRPGGLLVVDDVFCQGDALNAEPTTDKGHGAQELLALVENLNCSKVVLPYGDGLLLLRKDV